MVKLTKLSRGARPAFGLALFTAAVLLLRYGTSNLRPVSFLTHTSTKGNNIENEVKPNQNSHFEGLLQKNKEMVQGTFRVSEAKNDHKISDFNRAESEHSDKEDFRSDTDGISDDDTDDTDSDVKEEVTAQRRLLSDLNPAPQDSLNGKLDDIKPGEPFWQWIDEDFEVSVYSAHYDDVEAPPVVRLVGLARDPLPYTNVVCRFHGCRDCPVMLRASGEVFHFRSGNGRRFLGAFILCPLGGLVEGVLPFGVSLQKDTDSKQATTMMRIHHSSQEQSRIVDNIQVKLLQRGSTVNEETLEDLKNMLTLRKRVQDDTFNKNQFWRETKKNEVEGVENSKTKNDDDNDSNNSSSSNRYRWNITRCFPAFQKDYDNHALLAEMVAASRAMGVDHFNFYVESIGPNVRKTLQVLQEKGLAEALPWNLHMNRTLLFYKGQFSAIQDCLYRHLRSSRYLLFGDVDELFMPFTSDSLVDLLDHWIKQRPTCGSFLFRNSFFSLKTIRPSPNEEDNNNNNHHADHQLQAFKLATQHGLTMVLHNKRDSVIWKPGYRSKVALDPRRTLVGSVHVVDKMRRGSRACQLDPDEGLLFHFRKGMRPPESRVVDDNRLWRRFAEPVVKETVEILEAVNKTGL